MKKKIIIGNWKMNPATVSEAKVIVAGIKRTALKLSKVTVALCPPYIYFSDALKAAGKGKLAIGVQDIFHEQAGSYTGEVSPAMVKNAGGTYAIVGHSERRRLGESDSIIAKKVSAGLSAGLTVVLCIGEHTRDDHGVYLAFIHEQLMGALSKVSKKFLKHLIIAYEPVWAIGRSDKDAITPRLLHEMVLYIRKVLSDEYGEDIGRHIPVLYGGSVFVNNAKEFLSEGMADGLLIGRESLKPVEFSTILKIAHEVRV